MNLAKNLFQSFIVASLYKFLNRKCNLLNVSLVFGVSVILFGLLDYLLINNLENFQAQNNAVDITGRINHRIVRLTNEITLKDTNKQFLKFNGSNIVSTDFSNVNNQQSDSYRFRFIDPRAGSFSNNAFVTNQSIFVIKTNGNYLKVNSAGGDVGLTSDINSATKFNIDYQNQDSSYTEIGDNVYIIVNGQKNNLTVLDSKLKSVPHKVGESGTGEVLNSQTAALFTLNNKFGQVYENLTLSSSITRGNKQGKKQIVYNLNENKIIEKIGIPTEWNDYSGSLIYYLDKNDQVISIEKSKIESAAAITEINVICYKIMVVGSNIKLTTTKDIEIFGESVYYSKLMEYPNIKNLFPNLSKKNDNEVKDYGEVEGSELPYVMSDYSISMWLNINNKNTQRKIQILNKNLSPSIELNKASNNNYYLSVTTKLKNKETPETPTVEIQNELLIANQDYNVIALFKNKVDKIFGWTIVKLKKSNDAVDFTYSLLNQSHKYYYELKNTSNMDTYASSNNLEIKEFSTLNRYHKRGDLDTKDTKFLQPTIELYLNGRRISKVSGLTNLIYNNNDRLQLGVGNKTLAKSGFIGNIYGVKFANYLLTFEEINDLAIRKTDNVIKYIITDSISANKNQGNDLYPAKSVPHIYLPSYDNVFSVGGWFRIDSEDLNISDDGKIFLLRKGNEKRSDFELGITGFSKVSFNAGKTPVSTFDKELPIKTWVHLTYVYNKVANEFSLYVNGNSNSNYYTNSEMSSKQQVSTPAIDISYVPLQVGPFFGRTKEVFFANYALSDEQVLSVMGNHPDININNTVTKLFQKTTDCQGIPFDLSTNPDSQAAFKVKEYVNQSKNTEDVNSDNFRKALNDKFKLQTIKTNADAYKTPGPSFQKEEFKKDYQYCYKNPYNPDDKSDCQARGSTGAEKRCLPLAPYTCPSKNTVNDFDIRTHQDFYKFVKNTKVRPPLMMEKNAPLGKYDITMDELSKHKDFGVLKNQILSNLDIPGLVNRIDNPEILRQIALNLNNNEKIDLGELIAATDNKATLRKAASSLLSSNDSSLDEIVSGLQPQQALKVISKMVGNNQVSSGNLLQLVKDSNELTNFIKQGLSDGTLKVNDLLEGQSAGNLKQVILNKCGNYSLNEIPGAQEKVKTLIQNKGLLTPKQAEKMQVDMNKYIRRDNIPCVGCKLSSK
jgi:hypothetical protein